MSTQPSHSIQDSKFWGLVVNQQYHQEVSKRVGLQSDVNFQTKVLDVLEKNKVSFEDLECAWQWDAEYLNDEASGAIHKYVSSTHILAISSIVDAVLLKKEYEKKYKDHKIDFNKEKTLSDTCFNATRDWLTIDGKNLKEFETTAPSPMLAGLSAVSSTTAQSDPA